MEVFPLCVSLLCEIITVHYGNRITIFFLGVFFSDAYLRCGDPQRLS